MIADPNNDGVYDWIIGGHTSPFTTDAVAFNALTLTTSGAVLASFDAAFFKPNPCNVARDAGR